MKIGGRSLKFLRSTIETATVTVTGCDVANVAFIASDVRRGKKPKDVTLNFHLKRRENAK